MAGIIFFKTKNLEAVTDFYTARMGMTVWLDQGGCVILRSGNLLLGFCLAEASETEGVITYFYKTRQEVDGRYRAFTDIARGQPRENQKYRIYQFFAEDPEGRTLEFQSFLDPVDYKF
jgi:catechol 2,3-dioxygenase-like lactoylglutathione lyase family enzyme